MLSINNLSYFIGGRALYENAALHIKPKDKIGLVGLNGTGKSTLLKIINGDIRSQNVREHFKQSRDSRVVTLSFSYRFGKNFNDNRRKTGGSSEEQQRVGVGG